MARMWLLSLAILACSTAAMAPVRTSSHRVAPAGQPPQGTQSSKNGTFRQLIDHGNPSRGTFSQFYYWDDYYYRGPGSPVVLFTPGEVDVTNYYTYLTTNRTTGVIAEELGAAVVVIEHRYWGHSSPFERLTTENMQFLTLQNAIADLNHFALTARLPFDPTGASNAGKAPWVLVGGSYSGALTAWTEATTSPSVMWAYYASSAVVETIGDFWEYFTPQTMYAPANCTTDISAVVEHLDHIGKAGSLEQQADVKTMFGLQDLTHYDDFMGVLANGPYLWQGNQFYENEGFFDFCDAVEGVEGGAKIVPGASGIGLKKALVNYAAWVKNELLPGYCASYGYAEFAGETDVDCFDTYDSTSPLFTDVSLANTYDRQWNWMLCNQPFGYWQDGAPSTVQTIVSRLITQDYWTRQCGLYFPTQDGYSYGIARGATEVDVDALTGGWAVANTTRLVFVNGEYDPWRQSTVSSTIRPGGPKMSTIDEPVFVVPGGFHTSDLVTANGAANPGCAQIQAAVVSQIKEWVRRYPK